LWAAGSCIMALSVTRSTMASMYAAFCGFPFYNRAPSSAQVHGVADADREPTCSSLSIRLMACRRSSSTPSSFARMRSLALDVAASSMASSSSADRGIAALATKCPKKLRVKPATAVC
jgi:hypothetical protein